MLRNLARRTLQLPSSTASRSRAGPVRNFAAPHPGIQEPTGILFGEKAIVGKAGRQWESWEHGYWATCVIGAVFGMVILPSRPDTSVKTWGALEANARKNAGIEEPELGKSYTVGASSYVKEGVGATPEVGEVE
jgi:hypothetical protein